MKKANVIVAAVLLLCISVHAEYVVNVSPDDDIAAVRDRIREERRQKKIADGETVRIIFAAGEYRLRNSVTLDARDSGSVQAPVVWCAEKGGRVAFSGGDSIPVSAFAPVTDPAVRSRLPEEARMRVRVADVSRLLPGDLPPWPMALVKPPAPWLYADGRPMELARWPNKTADGKPVWAHFSKAARTGIPLNHKNGNFASVKPGAFFCEDERADRWNPSKGLWLSGYWTHDWSDEILQVESIEKSSTNRVVSLKGTHKYGICAGTWGAQERRYCAVNLIEELDAPGEWWLDREAKKLYVYAGDGFENTKFRLATLDRPFFELNNVGNVRFENLTFAYSHCLKSAVSIFNCENVVFDGCSLRSLAGDGINAHGRGIVFKNGRILRIGAAGVRMNGGDKARLVPSGNAVINSEISDFGVFQRTYAPAVFFDGVGNTVSGCRIHDAPHAAILYLGNNSRIVSNEIYRVMLETGDAGAVYSGRDPSSLGNVIEGNRFHDLGGDSEELRKCTMAVYFDDCDWGDRVVGNRFENLGTAVFIGGGNLHPVVGNTMVGCGCAVHIDARGVEWRAKGMFCPNAEGESWYFQKMKPFDPFGKVWGAAYPELKTLLADRPELPHANPITNNVFIGCRKDFSFDKLSESVTNECPIVGNRSEVPRYDAPLPAESGYEAWMGGKRVYVRPVRVSAMPFNQWAPGYQRPVDQTEIAGMVAVESDGTSAFRVRPKRSFSKAVVRPLSAGVKPVVRDGEVLFTLPKPGYYVLEIDGQRRPLEMFVEPKRDFSDERREANVVFGPGLHEPLVVKLKSHDRVYIDKDAVVFGSFQMDGVEDVKISGYGVISGARNRRVGNNCYRDGMESSVRIIDSRKVVLDGPIVLDSPCWMVEAFNSSDIEISHVKVTGAWRYNTDGIDICNTQRVRIHDAYVHSFDDSIVLKGIWPKPDAESPVEDIRVERCVCWCGWGRTLEVGFETWAPRYRNIVFEDCDLIHNSSGALSVHLGGPAPVEDVTYRNIRIEYAADDLKPMLQRGREAKYEPKSPWSGSYIVLSNHKMFQPESSGYLSMKGRPDSSKEPFGTFRSLTFENIAVTVDEGAATPGTWIKAEPGSKFGKTNVRGITINGVPQSLVLRVAPVEGNATPMVREAVARLGDGDTLRFEKGEYHFFEDGAEDLFLASVGSSTGMKKVAVHLEGKRNVTVDGGGSTFVFHGNTFPFVAERCDGVKICNFVSRVFRLPLVEFTITEKNDEGFLCKFSEGHAPYETKDGEIFFDMDEGRTDSREREISVHALRYCKIQYIATPGCKCDKDKLASTFYPVAAEDRGGGQVFFRYVKDDHPKNGGKCSYPQNEPLCLLLGCGRNRSVLAFADCRDVEVADVDIRSGVAMGIVAEMCENVKIARYRVRPDDGQHVSLTADAIYLVDTKGQIEIADSEICWALDDAMNIHGNYTRLDKTEGRRTTLSIQHHAYAGYFPYRVGETVEFSRGQGPDKKILGCATVAEFPKPGRDATSAVVMFDRDIPAEWIGCDVANVSHAPKVWIHGNYIHDYMHNRLSAFADIVFERNRLCNGSSVILHADLTGYWGECGPAHSLTVRDNDCEDMRHTYFDFCVPFSGRALLEGNRLKGRSSENPFRFGPGVAKSVEIR